MLIGYFQLFLLGALFIYIVISGGADHSGPLWCYVYPLSVLFVFGLKTGFAFVSGFFTILLIILFPPGIPFLETEYSSVFKFRFIGSFLTVFAISCFFEHVRAVTQGKVVQRNSALQSTLQKLQQTCDALQKRETQYRTLFESANDAISIIRISPMNSYHIVDCNGKMLEIFHCTREEIIGKTLDHFSPEIQPDGTNSHEKIVDRIHQALQDKPQFFEWYYIYPDGMSFVAEVSFDRVELSGKIFIQAIVRDISDRKKMEDELRRSNIELEQFAYVASHDLQEPLRMVSSYLKLLVKRNKDRLDSDSNEFINYAVDGAKRMNTLINDLLSYSRLDTHRKDFDDTDCEEVYKTAIKNLEIRIAETNAKVTTDVLPTLVADQGQLVQLFQNLIGNSLKFIKDRKPDIHIIAKQKNAYWVFGIKDNGIGIESKYQEQIFKIFQRLHSRAEYGGTGIGLAVCKKIVDRHGGSIWVESEPGIGTTFYFSIPTRCQKNNARLHQYH
jgi:PAS domain S-box-containing protein